MQIWQLFIILKQPVHISVYKRDLQSLYLSGTYCHNTGANPPSCVTPRQPTKYLFVGSSHIYVTWIDNRSPINSEADGFITILALC